MKFEKHITTLSMETASSETQGYVFIRSCLAFPETSNYIRIKRFHVSNTPGYNPGDLLNVNIVLNPEVINIWKSMSNR